MSELSGKAAVATTAGAVNYTFGKEDVDRGSAKHAFSGGVRHGSSRQMLHDIRALRRQEVLTRRRHNASTRTV